MSIKAVDVENFRADQIYNYNKRWCRCHGLNFDAATAAHQNDPEYWPEVRDYKFPRGEQLFWIVEVTCDGQVSERLLQGTCMQHLWDAMADLSAKIGSEEGDSAPGKIKHDIFLEGDLFTEPMGSVAGIKNFQVNTSEWKQLALCSFYEPGDEINVELRPKAQKGRHQISSPCYIL